MKSIEKKIKVWIIEDNYDFRSSLETLINSLSGFNCLHSFEKCEDAIAYLKTSDPPDIILSDIELPGISGIEGIKYIKEISPEPAVVMLTVHDEHNKVFEAIKAGASGYLLKTASDDEIINSLEQIMNGGAPINARIARAVLEMFRNSTPERKEYGLSDREKQILELLVKGLSKPRIAEQVFLSHHTIDYHVRSIYKKLHVNSRQGAVAKAVKEKLF
jgi:DNA-binding NarL/FixJ family response regulator